MLVANAALRFHPKVRKLVAKLTHTPSTESLAAAGKGVVQKLVNGKLEPVTCQLGITDSHFTEVTCPKLNAGDEVVTNYLVGQGQSTSSNSFRVRMF